MVGRANALVPALKFETVKAMLEAAMASVPLPVAMEIEDQVIVEKMPDLIGGMERRFCRRCTAAPHQPDLPVLRSCVERQPPDASQVRVRRMRF